MNDEEIIDIARHYVNAPGRHRLLIVYVPLQGRIAPGEPDTAAVDFTAGLPTVRRFHRPRPRYQ